MKSISEVSNNVNYCKKKKIICKARKNDKNKNVDFTQTEFPSKK